MTRRRRIVIVVYDGCQPIDAAGPAEVFVGANQVRPGSYRVTIASMGGGPVRCGPAITLGSDPIERLEGRPDTLLVAGGFGARVAAGDRAFMDALRCLATQSRRVRRCALER